MSIPHWYQNIFTQPQGVTKLNIFIRTIHRYRIQSIFSRSLIFAFNSRIDSLHSTDWGKRLQSRHALKTLNLCHRKSILQQVSSAISGNLVMLLKTKYDHINSRFRLFKELKTSDIKAGVFDEMKFSYYPEEAHRSICCSYTSFFTRKSFFCLSLNFLT